MKQGNVQYVVHQLRLWHVFARPRKTLRELNDLRLVLSRSSKPITLWHLTWVMTRGTTTIFVARLAHSHRIIGMSSLVISPQLLAGKGWLEDVGILPEFRGTGMGKVLTAKVVFRAKLLGIRKLDLTSSNDIRYAAQGLYGSFGWRTRDSWLARLDPNGFDPKELLTPDQLALVV